MSTRHPLITLIAAVSRNGVIGRDGALPWRLPEDMAHFKALTMGKPLILGRRTFESIGRPLPGRHCIVITSNERFQAPGVLRARSLKDALGHAARIAADTGAGEIMVGGGAEIYAAALPHADRIYLTEVHADVSGDVHFPSLDRHQWRETAREDRKADTGPAYSFVTLERTGP